MEFIVNKIKTCSKLKSISIITACDNNSLEDIEKDIIAHWSYNFIVGNSYKANILEEDENSIYIDYKSIRAIEIDNKVFEKLVKKLKQSVDKEDIRKFLTLTSIEDIKKETKDYGIKDRSIINEIINSYNENNLTKLLNNYIIDNRDEIIQNSLIRFKNIDIVKLYKERPYYLAIYGVNINKLRLINDKYINYSEIIFLLKESEGTGRVFMYIYELEIEILDLFKKKHVNLNEELKKLEKEDLIIVSNDKIYLKESYSRESSLISNIKNRINFKGVELTLNQLSKVNEVIDNCTLKLNNEQREAVIHSLDNNITIITGGAGTGKTTIIETLLKSIKKINSKNTVEVVSLSGKAVSVINNKIQNQAMIAKTIHRLFNINSFQKDSRKIESLDYLIIDEISMLDIKLLELIFTSIPITTKLILLGDINQALPIGIGNPILDIMNSKAISIIELKENKRQGNLSIIAENSKRVLKLDVDLSFNNDEFEFIGTNKNDSVQKVIDKIKYLIDVGYELNDITILTTRKHKAKYINNKISEFYLKELRRHNKLVVKDKVIQIENDYNRNVFNGQVGKIVMVEKDNVSTTINVDFGKNIVKYKNKAIEQLELAYSLTIHKMQGSENRIIILVVDDKDRLNNNLIYTAVTRASEKFIAIGDRDIFNNGISKLPGDRNSRILEELKAL